MQQHGVDVTFNQNIINETREECFDIALRKPNWHIFWYTDTPRNWYKTLLKIEKNKGFDTDIDLINPANNVTVPEFTEDELTKNGWWKNVQKVSYILSYPFLTNSFSSVNFFLIHFLFTLRECLSLFTEKTFFLKQ